MKINFVARLLGAALIPFFSGMAASAQGFEEPIRCGPVHEAVNGFFDRDLDGSFGRTVCADIVAMDQMLVHNRFGSFNPYGMIYALRRDVVPAENKPEAFDANACDKKTGVEGWRGALAPGKVRLKDCKRPRPLTLRANVGDVLHVRLSNLLRETDPSFSHDYCGAEGRAQGGPFGLLYHRLRDWGSEGSESQVNHGEVSCRAMPISGSTPDPDDTNWPASRGANLAIQGLTAFGLERRGGVWTRTDAPDACTGLGVIRPGATVDCYYLVEREGPYFMASTGAPSGGQGDGGSLTHGLFGAVNAQPKDTRWHP